MFISFFRIHLTIRGVSARAHICNRISTGSSAKMVKPRSWAGSLIQFLGIGWSTSASTLLDLSSAIRRLVELSRTLSSPSSILCCSRWLKVYRHQNHVGRDVTSWRVSFWRSNRLEDYFRFNTELNQRTWFFVTVKSLIRYHLRSVELKQGKDSRKGKHHLPLVRLGHVCQPRGWLKWVWP